MRNRLHATWIAAMILRADDHGDGYSFNPAPIIAWLALTATALIVGWTTKGTQISPSLIWIIVGTACRAAAVVAAVTAARLIYDDLAAKWRLSREA